jgi:uncharacterized protein with von Willebrand factor type A (vWA) domain
MLEGFFYRLRDCGVPVSPTAFLRLQQALSEGLVTGLDDLYVVARSLLIKRERHLDLYDRVFAACFEGCELDDEELAITLEHEIEQTLRAWLADPQLLDSLSPEQRAALEHLDPEALIELFLQRLQEQKERHAGGNHWIGAGGTSPFGHGGQHPGGLRVGGAGGGRSAIKVALERRFIDYSDDTPLAAEQIGEALGALKHLAPEGPRDQLDIDASIRETVRQGGEIELVFNRRLRDRLDVALLIDNGGWSMLPYSRMTQALFANARDTFRRLDTYFFHNCIYDTVWRDSRRTHLPVALDDVLRNDPETRLIIVGDASMAPWELQHRHGAIDISFAQRRPGIDCLRRLADRFSAAVWINPIPEPRWGRSVGSWTINEIRTIFPMVDLSLAGIEKAVQLLRP